MVRKSIAQLREKALYVLNRKGKQRKKLLKAYHGRRKKKLWSDRASWECCSIAEIKDEEFVGHRMKGEHHHRRNYCICSVCGHWFRRNKGIHDENQDGPLHFCDMNCARQAEFEGSIDADVGGYFEPHYWDEKEDAEWRRKKNEKV